MMINDHLNPTLQCQNKVSVLNMQLYFLSFTYKYTYDCMYAYGDELAKIVPTGLFVN